MQTSSLDHTPPKASSRDKCLILACIKISSLQQCLDQLVPKPYSFRQLWIHEDPQIRRVLVPTRLHLFRGLQQMSEGLSSRQLVELNTRITAKLYRLIRPLYCLATMWIDHQSFKALWEDSRPMLLRDCLQILLSRNEPKCQRSSQVQLVERES